MNSTINQNNDTYELLAWQILTVAPIIKKRLFRPDFEQEGEQLPLSYLQVLATLNNKESMTVTEISERFDIARPNITPLIDRMIEAGYVKRVRNSTDRRVVHVVILDKGREKVTEMIKALMDSIHGWSEEITEDDLKRVTEAIDVIHTIIG